MTGFEYCVLLFCLIVVIIILIQRNAYPIFCKNCYSKKFRTLMKIKNDRLIQCKKCKETYSEQKLTEYCELYYTNEF